MTYREILSRDEFQKCLEFHGHLCPGLAIGYRAAEAGLEWLREKRAFDEELVAIVETDACGADAVQVLTGCTFGKGNFIFRDHGKNVYTFASRRSGSGVRVALRAGAFQPSDRHMELIRKMRGQTATDEEKREFRSLHERKSHEILEKEAAELFTVEWVDIEVPPKAMMEPSDICDACGEPTMASKVQQEGSSRLCRSCAQTKD
ncbi:MAG: formylmethanofuran dehydrogenase [Deltaproteobacteria bacterium]|nr:formylmethanofuran dehydrogenase [Deltaproteobacteria bacterium]